MACICYHLIAVGHLGVGLFAGDFSKTQKGVLAYGFQPRSATITAVALTQRYAVMYI